MSLLDIITTLRISDMQIKSSLEVPLRLSFCVGAHQKEMRRRHPFKNYFRACSNLEIREDFKS